MKKAIGAIFLLRMESKMINRKKPMTTAIPNPAVHVSNVGAGCISKYTVSQPAGVETEVSNYKNGLIREEKALFQAFDRSFGIVGLKNKASCHQDIGTRIYQLGCILIGYATIDLDLGTSALFFDHSF